MICTSALDLVRQTPLVALDRVHTGPGRIVAKAEFMLPGGSMKDRSAWAILSAAKADGRLRPGMTVVEMTSGNMGAGLAVVCAVLGHPLVLIMSAGNSAARVRMLEGLGAKVVLVPQVDGSPGQVTGADISAASAVALSYSGKCNGFLVDQFNAAEPISAHQHETGAELIEQAGMPIAAWVASVGTGATFMGVARALKAVRETTRCYAVEPQGSQPLAGFFVDKPRHIIQGIGYGTVPPHWEPNLCDGTMAVSDEEAESWRVRLAWEEGLYVGYSAAANVCAASRLLASGILGSNAVVATILCDTGMKY